MEVQVAHLASLTPSGAREGSCSVGVGVQALHIVPPLIPHWFGGGEGACYSSPSGLHRTVVGHISRGRWLSPSFPLNV